MKNFSFSTTFFVIVTLLVALATLVFAFFTFKAVNRMENTQSVTQQVTATPTATASPSAEPTVSVSPKAVAPLKKVTPVVTKPVVTVAPTK